MRPARSRYAKQSNSCETNPAGPPPPPDEGGGGDGGAASLSAMNTMAAALGPTMAPPVASDSCNESCSRGSSLESSVTEIWTTFQPCSPSAQESVTDSPSKSSPAVLRAADRQRGQWRVASYLRRLRQAARDDRVGMRRLSPQDVSRRQSRDFQRRSSDRRTADVMLLSSDALFVQNRTGSSNLSWRQ